MLCDFWWRNTPAPETHLVWVAQRFSAAIKSLAQDSAVAVAARLLHERERAEQIDHHHRTTAKHPRLRASGWRLQPASRAMSSVNLSRSPDGASRRRLPPVTPRSQTSRPLGALPARPPVVYQSRPRSNTAEQAADEPSPKEAWLCKYPPAATEPHAPRQSKIAPRSHSAAWEPGRSSQSPLPETPPPDIRASTGSSQ